MREKVAAHFSALVSAMLVLSSAVANSAMAKTEVNIEPGASCTSACHTDYAAKKKNVHPAAANGNSCATMCHQPVEKGKHAFKPIPANKSEQCYTCHDEDKFKGAAVHKPVQAGSCTKCHDPHQSDQAKLLRKPAPQLCFSCHDEDEFKGKVVHGPVAEGKCLACHAAHAADQKKLLDKTSPDLCLGCHSARLKDAQGRMLSSIKSLLDDKNATLHPPFAKGQCSFCHQPHASESARLTSKGYPADFYASFGKDAYGLCFTCHSSKAFEEPRTLTETQFRNGNLNLHHRHVNRDKGRSCGACHSPHGSRQARLIDQGFQFGKQTLPLRYDKTETGGSCATACHVPVSYDRCDPAVISMRTSTRQGQDASDEDLVKSCEKKQ